MSSYKEYKKRALQNPQIKAEYDALQGQTLTDLYDERTPLYERYADIVIDEEGKDLEASLELLLETLKDKSEQ